MISRFLGTCSKSPSAHVPRKTKRSSDWDWASEWPGRDSPSASRQPSASPQIALPRLVNLQVSCISPILISPCHVRPAHPFYGGRVRKNRASHSGLSGQPNSSLLRDTSAPQLDRLGNVEAAKILYSGDRGLGSSSRPRPPANVRHSPARGTSRRRSRASAAHTAPLASFPIIATSWQLWTAFPQYHPPTRHFLANPPSRTPSPIFTP